MWDGGIATALTTPAGFARSEGYGINATRQVVGYAADANYVTMQAMLWTGTTPTSLGALPGRTYTKAVAINAAGTVVGTARSYNGDGGGDAFVWANGQMLNLNDLIPAASNWHLTSATDINDAGQIVGYGIYNEVGTSFVLTPIPEPASLGLLGIGMAGVVLRPRRNGR